VEEWNDKNSAVYVYKKIVEAYKGPLAGKIIEVLAEHGELTEDELAEKVGADEAEVRRVIWVLASEGLIVSHIIDRLEEKLRYETENIFYWCMDPNHSRLTFSEATENMFRCPVCGKTLMPYDNSELLAAIKYCISEMRKIMKDYFIEEKSEE